VLTSLHLDSIPWLTSNWGIKTTISVMVIGGSPGTTRSSSLPDFNPSRATSMTQPR
jgi:hypothetical protein